MAALVYLLIFAAVVLFVHTSAGVLFTVTDGHARVNRRLSLLDSGLSRDQVYQALVRRPAGGDASWMALGRWLPLPQRYVGQSGVKATFEQLLMTALGLSAGFWVVGLAVSSAGAPANLAASALFSLPAAVALGFASVALWVARARARRIKAFEEQLPAAIDIVTRALRAGHPVIAAMQLAGNEMGDPVGSEFGLVVDETTYGFEFEQALENMARRTGSSDAHFFAVSVNIQSETGGNLAEILGNLASVIRSRMTLKKRVKSLSSEGRMSAIVISVLPCFVIAVQMLVQPTTYTSKFSDPIFWPVAGGTMVVYAIGWAVIHRIINFKY